MKIVKILLDDGTSREVENLKPFSYFKEQNDLYHIRNYKSQFDELEYDIIEIIGNITISEYAKDNLGLVEENDISDYSDSELLEEMEVRKLKRVSSITDQILIERIENIAKVANYNLLNSLLSDLENKLNI